MQYVLYHSLNWVDIVCKRARHTKNKKLLHHFGKIRDDPRMHPRRKPKPTILNTVIVIGISVFICRVYLCIIKFVLLFESYQRKNAWNALELGGYNYVCILIMWLNFAYIEAKCFCDCFYPRPVLAFGYCRWLRLSVCVCGKHLLVRAITCHAFKLESPNLDPKSKTPWLRSLLFFGVIDLELQGQI